MKKTPADEEYYEISNDRGAVLAEEMTSGKKKNERPGSKGYPVDVSTSRNISDTYIRDPVMIFKGQKALTSHVILPKTKDGSAQHIVHGLILGCRFNASLSTLPLIFCSF